MLTLTQQEYIKFLRERETLSISEISKRVDVDWRTAKKYADKEDWNIFETSRSTNACKIMDPFMEIVTTWITEDKLMPCLLYTSDAADEEDSVDLGGRRI